MNNVETIVRSIVGGVFAQVDYTIPAETYIRKASPADKTMINPLWNRKEEIVLERENVQINLGVIYGQAINGRLERKEIEPSFEVEAMKGKRQHNQPHKNLCMSIDGSKTYVRYMPCQNHNSTSRFMLDGQDVTAQLQPFMAPKKPESQKQKNAGLTGAEQVEWRTLNLAHIDKIKVLGVEVENV